MIDTNRTRIIDTLLILTLSPVLIIIFFILYLLIYIMDGGSPLHISPRVGKGGKVFNMPKFRSMKTHAPNIATEDFEDIDYYLTRTGKFTRKYKLDEFPQVYSILKGDMSLIGPRPALFNQYDLIALRKKHGLLDVKPGLTGYGQIYLNNKFTLNQKIRLEKLHLKDNLCQHYFILLKTLLKTLSR